MTKYIYLFMFIAQIMYTVIFANIFGIFLVLVWAISKVFGFDFDIFRIEFFKSLLIWSSVMGFVMTLLVTNKQNDNGIFWSKHNGS